MKGLLGALIALIGLVTLALLPAAAFSFTVCNIFQGCTGTSTVPAYGQVLIGGKNGEYEYAASSTFGGSGSGAVSSVFGRIGAVTAQSGDYTTSLIPEGSNLYWTQTRFDNALTATTSLPKITTLAGLSLPYSQLTGTPAIASSTLLSDRNTWSGWQNFSTATSTALTTSYLYDSYLYGVPGVNSGAVEIGNTLLPVSNGGTSFGADGQHFNTFEYTTWKSDNSNATINVGGNIAETLSNSSGISFYGNNPNGAWALQIGNGLAGKGIGPENDNTNPLGGASNRWSALYTVIASTTQMSATTICFTGDHCLSAWPTTGASSTLLSDNNTFSGNNIFGAATSSSFAVTHIASSLLFANNIGSVIGTTTLDAAFGGTGSTTLGGILAGNGLGGVKSAIMGTGVSFDGTTLTNTGITSNGGDWAGTWQTFSPAHFLTSLAGAASSTLLGDNNTFSGFNIFTKGILASTTIGNGAQAGGLTINGGATTTGNAFFTGSGFNSGYGTIEALMYGAQTEEGFGWDNTGTGGRYYDIFSSDNSSGVGGGNLIIGDVTSGTALQKFDASHNLYFPQLTSNGVLATNGGNGAVSVAATSTLTPSSPLTGSFVQIGSSGSLGCQTASGSQAGCLSSGDWSTFNGKLNFSNIYSKFITYATSTIGTTTPSYFPTAFYASSTPGVPDIVENLFVNGKSTTTNATTTTFAITSAPNYTILTTTGDGAVVGSSTVGSNLLSNSGVTGGSYTNANITVNAQGIVTVAANGSAGGGSWPFTTTNTNFGQAVQSTTTAEWFEASPFSLMASGTAQFVFASTTQLSATSLCLNGDICRTTWSSASVSGGTTGMLTSWSNSTTLTATGTPTFASFFGTSTVATSTLLGALTIGTSTDGTNPANMAMLTIDAGTRSSQELMEMYGNNSTFLEDDVRNLNSSGQGCRSATRNDGTQTTNFVSLCVNGTTFWNPQPYNVGGPNDSSIMFSSGDGYVDQAIAGQKLHFLNGGTSTSTNEFMTVGANGRVGLSSTTPWGIFSIASSTYNSATNGNEPLFAVATSSDPFGWLMGAWATSTTLASFQNPQQRILDSGVRVAIGTTQTYDYPGLLDQLTVNGRINTGDWHYVSCDGNTVVSLSSDTPNACGQFGFQVDAAGQISNDYDPGSGINDVCMTNRAATCATNSSGGANNGSGLFFPDDSQLFLESATATPVMEATARIGTTRNSTSTSYYIGFSNLNPQGSTFEVEPTAGCYFVASTTIATGNWQAMARTSASAETFVDTGFASSTKVNSLIAGDWYRFRVEADNNGCTFYMASSTQKMEKVATITTNVPKTVDLEAGVFQGNVVGTLTTYISVNSIKLWFRQPALNY
jgi:hypothetical protein